MNRLLVGALGCLLSFNVLSASWVINKDHSEIMFKVSYLNVSELTGRFTEYSGLVELDEGKKSFGKISITILTDSADTGHKMRDNHLEAHEFFNSREFPKLTFVSTEVKNVGKDKYSAKGDLTIKGITKPSAITFTLTDSVKDTWGYENKFAKFEAVVNRKDFNLNWNKTLDGSKYLVGDDVTVWGVFQIQPSKGVTPSSKHMIPDTEYIRGRDDELRKETPREEESTISKKLRKLINGK